MDRIGMDKVRTIATHAGIKPGKVKGVNIIQFTKGNNSALEIITWADFERILNQRNWPFTRPADT